MVIWISRFAGVSAFAALLLMAVFTWAGQGELVLLRPAGNFSSEGVPGKPLAATSIIARQRLALVNSSVLSNARNIDVDEIQLDLFDDVRLRAMRQAVHKGTHGAVLWTGLISGPERGEVILIARDRKVSASITLPANIYQIRPYGATYHVVRQIKRDVSLGLENLPSGLSDAEKKLIELVNRERVAEGLSPLRCNARLCLAARKHAEDMARRNYYSHSERDGGRFYNRIYNAGYPISKCGENIAVGFTSAEEVFEGWIIAPEHRVNILNGDFTETGVGFAWSRSKTSRLYWTQDFGAGGKCPISDRLRGYLFRKRPSVRIGAWHPSDSSADTVPPKGD